MARRLPKAFPLQAEPARRKPTDTVQLNLRFSERLRRRLAREAKQRNCSLNTEIVARLEESLRSQSFHPNVANALLVGLDEAVVDQMVALYLRERQLEVVSMQENLNFMGSR
jgi:hypothetical protein